MFYNPVADSAIPQEFAEIYSDSKISQESSFAEIRNLLNQSKTKTDRTFFIFVGNNKGGVGKTALSVQLTWHLALMGYNSLLVEMDAQANITCGLLEDQDSVEAKQSLYDLLFVESTKVSDVVFNVADGFDLMGANSNLSKIDYNIRQNEVEDLSDDFFARDITKTGKTNQFYLSCFNLLKSIGKEGGYDFVIFDTPPETNKLGRLALQVADLALVPIQAKESVIKGYSVVLSELNDSFKTIDRDNSNVEDICKAVFNECNHVHIPGASDSDLKEMKLDLVDQLKNHFRDKMLNTTIPYDYQLGLVSEVGYPAYLKSDVNIQTIEDLFDLTKSVVSNLTSEKQSVSKRRHMFLNGMA